MKITPITFAAKHLHHKASDLAHEVRNKAGRVAINLAGSKTAPRFFQNMVLEKIHNRWSGVKEQFQLHASENPEKEINEFQKMNLLFKANKITLDESSVRQPGQPLCGPRLTLAVNRKLLELSNNCSNNTREMIGELLSMDAVHARAMKDMGDAIRAGRYASTDMLLKDVMTMVEEAPPSNHRDVPPDVLIAGILVPLPLAPEMKLQLMHTLIPDWQDGYSSDEESLQGSDIAGGRRSIAPSECSTSSRGPTSSDWLMELTSSEQDGVSASPTPDAQTSSAMPSKRWLEQEVASIQRHIKAGIRNHPDHARRLEAEARQFELEIGIPFDASISALREALEGLGHPVPEYAKNLLADATRLNKEATAAFRSAVFFGFANHELAKKIHALPQKFAAATDNAAAVVREELEQIVIDVQSALDHQHTASTKNDDEIRLELEKFYHACRTPDDKAVGDLVREIRLQMMQ